jgi:hypothetical protein
MDLKRLLLTFSLGCQNDTAQNLLVGPAGNDSEQVQCSDTPMQPNDAPQDATWFVIPIGSLSL